MSTIKLDLTEGQVNNAIAVAIAEAFSQESKDKLIRDIIRGHLSQKADSWNKETMFSRAVGEALREMVKTQIDKEVESLRPTVEEMVKETFSGNIKTSIIEQLKYSLQKVALDNISVSISVGKDYD